MLASGLVVAGRYELVESLGTGAMGQVWRARDTRFESRFVAVKFLREDETLKEDALNRDRLLVRLEQQSMRGGITPKFALEAITSALAVSNAEGLKAKAEGRFGGGAGLEAIVVTTLFDELVNDPAFNENARVRAKMRRLFRDEANTVANLRHDNIVSIFDYGDHEGSPYLVMDYIEGRTLFQVIQAQEVLSRPRRLQLIEDLCAGLGYAHRHKLVHRDIKPANLIIDSSTGSLKILDFGVVRRLGAASTIGVPVGTFCYMSPEQTKGAATLDHRSDIFAVGLVFYELMTGRKAFAPGKSIGDLVARIQRDPPTPVSELVPSTPKNIEDVINKALEKQPEARYQDLAVMGREIGKIRARLEAAELSDRTSMSGDATMLATKAPPQPNALELLANADRAFDAGDDQKVIDICNGILAQKPGFPAAMSLLARVEARRRDHRIREAVQQVEQFMSREELTSARAALGRAREIDSSSSRLRTLEERLNAVLTVREERRRAEEERRRAEAEAERQRAEEERRRANEAEAGRQAAERDAPRDDQTMLIRPIGAPPVFRPAAKPGAPPPAPGRPAGAAGPARPPALPADDEETRVLKPPTGRRRRTTKPSPGIDSPAAAGIDVPAPTAAAPTVVRIDSHVQFTVYRPSVVAPERWYPLLAFAHLADKAPDAAPGEPDPIQVVKEQAAALLGGQAADFRAVTQDSLHAVMRSGELRFVPRVEGVEFNPPERRFLWTESVHREEFRMRASAAVDGRTVRGTLTVFAGNVLLADVALAVTVSHDAVRTAPPPPSRVIARPYHRIFASYSHRDASIVREFESHARALGHQYLRDVVALRSGEVWSDRISELIDNADVFQLFWSSNSMDSPFVRAEWEHAIALGRPHFIRPVYWEDPLPERPGLPPPELKAAHFEKIYPATARVDMAAPPTRPSAAGVRPVIVDREATQKIDRETVRKPVSPQATTEWSASVESRKPPISSPGGPVNDRIIAAAAVVALLVAVLIFILPVSAWVRFALIALVAAIAILGWRFWGGQGGSGMTRF